MNFWVPPNDQRPEKRLKTLNDRILGGDFLTPEWNRPLAQEETNLLYVSATRALETLDITDCASAHVDEVLKTNEKIRRMEEGVNND